MNLDEILTSIVANAAASGNFAGGPASAATPAQQVSPTHTGLFGLKGTGRDLLGVLGDAFLLQSGNKPMYRPAREQEVIGDAFQNFESDPLGAIGKIGAVNGPLGAKLYDSHLDSADRQAATEAKVNYQNFNSGLKLATQAGGLLSAANPQTYGPMLARLKQRAEDIGQPGMFDGLPATYDPAAIKKWQTSSMNYYQQKSQEYRGNVLGERSWYHGQLVDQGERRLDISQQNADTAGRRADTGQQNADTNTKKASKPKKVGEYIRKDNGKKVIVYDDGSEQEGSAETRPTGRSSGRGGSSAPAPSGTPKPGEVRKGYRFKGGNPASKDSWEKI